MSTEPPGHVTVCGKRYTVKFVAQHEMVNANPEGSRGVGETHHETHDILIGDWLCAQMQQETLLHEVLHIAYAVGIPDVQFTGVSGEDIEEAIVSGMDTPLLAAMRDNPNLLAYLLEDLA